MAAGEVSIADQLVEPVDEPDMELGDGQMQGAGNRSGFTVMTQRISRDNTVTQGPACCRDVVRWRVEDSGVLHHALLVSQVLRGRRAEHEHHGRDDQRTYASVVKSVIALLAYLSTTHSTFRSPPQPHFIRTHVPLMSAP